MSSSPRTYSGVHVVSLLFVALLGLIHLAYPFGGDQALFAVGARSMAKGAVLYRDFWDAKQPAIYWFYLTAGKLLGFTEVGIHTFELLYMLVFCVVLILALKPYFQIRHFSALVPILTVGVYYGSGHNQLTQVESLVGLPMFLAAWFAADSVQREKASWLGLLLSGIFGGIVLLFKLFFLPIVGCFWAASCWLAFARHRHEPVKFLTSYIVPICLGLLISIGLTVAYFARIHDLANLIYATWDFPREAARELPWKQRIGQLLVGFQWFLDRFAPLLALGFVGAWASLRRSRDPLTINLVLWLGAGLFVIILQRYSWWDYHYMLLFVPLGILASKGIEVLWIHLRDSGTFLARPHLRFALVAALVLLFSPIASSWAMEALQLAHHHFALSADDRIKLQGKIDSYYATAHEEVGFLLLPDSLPGDIFVFGDPVFYLMSERNQAIPFNGWSPDTLLREQWKAVEKDLARAQPPYIFVARDFEISPAVIQLIGRKYDVLHTSPDGVWYILREAKRN